MHTKFRKVQTSTNGPPNLESAIWNMESARDPPPMRAAARLLRLGLMGLGVSAGLLGCADAAPALLGGDLVVLSGWPEPRRRALGEDFGRWLTERTDSASGGSGTGPRGGII